MIGYRTTTLTEPVIGYRNWHLEDGLLHSKFLPDVPWREATMHARCSRKHAHRLLPHLGSAPQELCRCGLYAFHTRPPESEPVRLSRIYEPVPTFFTKHAGCVAGAVVAWGRIQVHTSGIRAQHMRVLAFQAPGEWSVRMNPERAEELLACARHYRVPILETGALVGYAEEFGAVVPAGERP